MRNQVKKWNYCKTGRKKDYIRRITGVIPTGRLQDLCRYCDPGYTRRITETTEK